MKPLHCRTPKYEQRIKTFKAQQIIIFDFYFRIDMLQGPENGALEAKIKQYYTESSQDEDSGVKGFVRIYYFNIFIWKFWKL